MARDTQIEPDAWVSGIVKALSDRHGQMDIQLRHVALSIPGSPLTVELNGAVSVAVHLRDLTDGERRAHVSRNLSELKGR